MVTFRKSMQKPRIFIAMHYMEIGGAESSLIGLLEALDPEKVDVDLFIYSHQGELMPLIPSWVNLLPEDKTYSCIERPMREAVMRGQLGVVFGRLLAKYRYKRYYKSLTDEEKKNDIMVFPFVSNSVMPYLPSLHKYGEYDLAISYLQPHDIVRKKVKAKKYLAWIHTDYSAVHVDKECELKIWSKYDYINSISPECTKGFISTFPSLAGKIVEIENILPKSIMLSKAIKKIPIENYNEKGVLTLCSVGRIGYAKNYNNIPYMAKELKELMSESENEKTLTFFKWYIVGPGDHSNIDKLSEKLGVKDNVIFLGPSDNPYPYIKNCDIYVHPSRYEGKSVVVREAQILCKPVIITNYPTSKSQINDGVDGIICELDNKKIAETIFNLANNKELQDKLISYLQTHDISGQSEVEKIYKLL